MQNARGRRAACSRVTLAPRGARRVTPGGDATCSAHAAGGPAPERGGGGEFHITSLCKAGERHVRLPAARDVRCVQSRAAAQAA